MSYVRMTGLTWPEAKQLEDAIGLIPTGAVEQHGPHLPLGTDCFIATPIPYGVGVTRSPSPIVL